jgi:hypothetical protein
MRARRTRCGCLRSRLILGRARSGADTSTFRVQAAIFNQPHEPHRPTPRTGELLSDCCVVAMRGFDRRDGAAREALASRRTAERRCSARVGGARGSTTSANQPTSCVALNFSRFADRTAAWSRARSRLAQRPSWSMPQELMHADVCNLVGRGGGHAPSSERPWKPELPGSRTIVPSEIR